MKTTRAQEEIFKIGCVLQQCIIYLQRNSPPKYKSFSMSKVSLNLTPKNYQKELLISLSVLSLWKNKLSIWENSQKYIHNCFLFFNFWAFLSLNKSYHIMTSIHLGYCKLLLFYKQHYLPLNLNSWYLQILKII